MSAFLVSQQCLDLGLRAGAIVLRDLRIASASDELRRQIERQVERIQQQYTSAADVRSVPELIKHFEILRQVGVKPRSHPPSTYKLLELARKRGTLSDVNNLVDAYNLVSVQTMCSLGAHDLDRIAVPIQLKLFTGQETFRPLGSTEHRAIQRGEFGYVDAEDRVICRLDSLQAEFSKVTEDTTSALLIIEATVDHDAQQLMKVFADTVEAVRRHCGGTAEIVSMPS